MGKLASLIAEEKRANGPACTVGIAMTTMSKDIAAELREVLADPSITGTAISRALAKLGHDLGASTLRRHRKGECGCGQSN